MAWCASGNPESFGLRSHPAPQNVTASDSKQQCHRKKYAHKDHQQNQFSDDQSNRKGNEHQSQKKWPEGSGGDNPQKAQPHTDRCCGTNCRSTSAPKPGDRWKQHDAKQSKLTQLASAGRSIDAKHSHELHHFCKSLLLAKQKNTAVERSVDSGVDCPLHQTDLLESPKAFGRPAGPVHSVLLRQRQDLFLSSTVLEPLFLQDTTTPSVPTPRPPCQ